MKFFLQFQGKGEVLTYWLLSEDRMKRLSRLESYLSEKQSPTTPVNNNFDGNKCDNDVKCDNKCEYSVPSSYSCERETKPNISNRPPLKRQDHSEKTGMESEVYENKILDKHSIHSNCVVPLDKIPLTDASQRKNENHIEMTPLLSDR